MTPKDIALDALSRCDQSATRALDYLAAKARKSRGHDTLNKLQLAYDIVGISARIQLEKDKQQ